MRPFAITKRETYAVVLKDDEAVPEPERMTFRCRTLTGGERLAVLRLLAPAADGKAGTFIATLDACRAACEYALVGWERVADQDGKSTPWPGSGARAVDLCPPSALLEIGQEIIRRSELGGAEAKV